MAMSTCSSRARTVTAKPGRHRCVSTTTPVHDGADQFLQWMAVDTTDGSVNVQFYDRRDDPANRLTRVTLARSTDGGQNFANYAWTAEPFATDRAFLGDYEWLVALGGARVRRLGRGTRTGRATL